MLEQAPAQDPDDYGGEAIKPMGEVPESERLDIDGLVADLSTRPPPPRLSSGPWEIPSIGPSKRVSLPPPALEPRARTFSIASLAGVAVAAYLLGLVTPPLVRWMDAAPARVEAPTIEEPAPVVEAAAIEAPQAETAPIVEVAAIEAPSAETPPVVEAPAIEAPAPVVAPVAQPIVARPVAQRPVSQPVVEPAPVVEAPPAEVASDLPESPSREAIQAAIESVRPAIQACADPTSRGQLARVRFTFAGEGRTAHALVEGVTGPTASCVARAARGVRVPAFSRDRFVVEFPFQL